MYSYPFNFMSQYLYNFRNYNFYTSVLLLFVNLAFLLQGKQLMPLISRDVADNNRSITMEIYECHFPRT